MKEALKAIADAALPAVIEAIKAEFVKANPGAPEPTNDDVKAALAASAGVDAAWLAAHPKP